MSAWEVAFLCASCWAAGSIVMWRYMLGVCDEEHDKVLQLEKDCDDLYCTLRMADNIAVEEGLFDEDEKCTGPEGDYPELEERWKKRS